MVQKQFKNARRYAALAGNMLKLAWQAQPACFTGLLLLQMLEGALPLGTAWVTKSLFDMLGLSLQGKMPANFLQGIGLLLIAQLALTVTGQLTSPSGTYLRNELTRHLTFKVQSQIYRKINSLTGLAPFEDPRFHKTIQMAAQGAQFGPPQMLNLMASLVQNTTLLIAFAGVLITFNPLLAGAVTVAVLPQLYAQLKIGHQRFDLAFQNNPKERRAWYYGNVLSGASFAKEVRLFNMGDYFLQAFQKLTREIQSTQNAQQKRELRWQATLSALSGLVSAGMFAGVALQAFAGRISLGEITLYLSAVVSVHAALAGLVFALANVNESVLFYTGYADLLALPQPLPTTRSPRPVTALGKGIELRNVSFRYNESQAWILRQANLFIPAGHCVALVGLNGAGKTTLVKLITRLYDPSEGAILWDGVDLREFDPVDLRRRMGVIFQDFGRYDMSVHENIGLGNIERINDRDRVHQVARQVGVDKLIMGLPQDYQTMLSRWLAEDGAGMDLSGGEWQKIAIARMFMRDADLLMLDEPTAALDAQAEYETYQNFVELMRRRTSLLISHRFSTVRMADAIAVLENGQITEYGSHSELFRLGGTYTALYNMQAERYR